MNRVRSFIGGVAVLAAVALGVPPQSAPAQIVYLPDGEEWQPMAALQEWENSKGHLVCTGECPGGDSCCKAASPS